MVKFMRAQMTEGRHKPCSFPFPSPASPEPSSQDALCTYTHSTDPREGSCQSATHTKRYPGTYRDSQILLTAPGPAQRPPQGQRAARAARESPRARGSEESRLPPSGNGAVRSPLPFLLLLPALRKMAASGAGAGGRGRASWGCRGSSRQVAAGRGHRCGAAPPRESSSKGLERCSPCSFFLPLGRGRAAGPGQALEPLCGAGLPSGGRRVWRAAAIAVRAAPPPVIR